MLKKLTSIDLINFEKDIKQIYEKGSIKAPIHLSGNNEDHLIKIFKKIKREDWVFSSWRNHYHAILHGVDKNKLFESIVRGNSMHTNNTNPNFYASSIVGGIIPIALGTSIAIKRMKKNIKTWCFVGDMTMETGAFHEAYKYSKNFDLPIEWVVEDNGISVHTPTEMAWGKTSPMHDDIIYYKYEMEYPHHGTGKWVNF